MYAGLKLKRKEYWEKLIHSLKTMLPLVSSLWTLLLGTSTQRGFGKTLSSMMASQRAWRSAPISLSLSCKGLMFPCSQMSKRTYSWAVGRNQSKIMSLKSHMELTFKNSVEKKLKKLRVCNFIFGTFQLWETKCKDSGNLIVWLKIIYLYNVAETKYLVNKKSSPQYFIMILVGNTRGQTFP